MNSLLYGGNEQSIRIVLVKKLFIEHSTVLIEKQINVLLLCFLLTLIVHIVHIIQLKWEISTNLLQLQP